MPQIVKYLQKEIADKERKLKKRIPEVMKNAIKLEIALLKRDLKRIKEKIFNL